MWQELRNGLRRLARRPSYLLLTMLTLALGIGASTSVFSIVRAVLLRPLPYRDQGRLVFVWNARAGNPNSQHLPLTGLGLLQLSDNAETLDGLAALELWKTGLAPRMDLFHPQGTERLRGGFATPNFFDVLGVSALIGRTFAPDDEGKSAILSYGLWQRRFGGDPAIVGQDVALVSGRRDRAVRTYTVVGILPARFHFTYPEETEVWVPLPWDSIEPTWAVRYQAVGRLKPGATVQQAQADATERLRDAVRTSLPLENPNRDEVIQRTFANAENPAEHLQHEVRSGLLLLAAVSVLLLLIACVNAAALVLARSVERGAEIAVRTALGATRWRLARSLLVDGLWIAAAGCIGGVLLAYAMQPVLRRLVPMVVPRADEISLDVQVLGFAVLASALTALVCGLAGLGSAAGGDLEGALRRSGGSLAGNRSVIRLRRLVMGFQVGVVVLLLVGAGLLLHSWQRLHQVDPGYDGRGVLTMEMRLIDPKYRVEGSIARFQQQVLERVRALPSVEQASITSAVPMRGTDFSRVVGPPGGPRKLARERSVDPGYFSLMRIPLIAGRPLHNDDTQTSPPVAVVSESLARLLFGSESPIGRRIETYKLVEIVGVVGDVRSQGLTESAPPAYYVPRTQHPSELVCLVIRTGPGSDNLAAQVRDAVKSIDPYQPVEKAATLDEVAARTTANQRFYTAAVASFAAAALLLAMIGLLGAVSRTVAERRREIAVRVALGAAPGRVVGLVLRDGMLPVLAGLAAGLLAALGASRLLEHLLFEITPLDPWSYAVTGLLVAAASVAACALPARRACRTDPMPVLKAE